MPNLTGNKVLEEPDDETARIVHLQKTAHGTNQSDWCLVGEKHLGGCPEAIPRRVYRVSNDETLLNLQLVVGNSPLS